MKTQRPPHGIDGFTLVELIVSITIIVILAGIVVAGMGFVDQKRAQEKAKVQVKLLEKGIEEYRFDNGVYPTVPNANPTSLALARVNNNAIFQRLYLDGVSNQNIRIYLAELDPAATGQGWITGSGVTTTYITDPWGREYRFRPGSLADGTLNPAAMGPGFDVWSMGKDGVTQPGTESEPYDKSASQNKDDVPNF
jgi:general secretion pathway protein G